ncbi:DEAD/DEAH box helicase [Campylobacter devanensis]|uniref:DEAD/DEAH box helicase n=1 Tax=Campylobacter devanensis TaxID=3161138 RepID=UPI000A33778C|nr:DEAD/DEAH box helicase family protein [Campylobacter sp. P0023]
MELKSYQKKAINDLESYLECLDSYGIKEGWNKYWQNKGVNAGKYHDKIKAVPNICAKVPTGGGKTFIACASIKVISDVVSKIDKIFVIWLVPSEAILTQTIKNLKNPKHPYRERLNADFNSDVEIFSSNDLLTKLNKSNLKSLNIAVLSFASIRINNKEMRKMYQQNGSLLDFDSFLDDRENLEDVEKLSVINVIRNFKPIVIVDESHNAKSNLSFEMLKNLNASFIYELTATPKDSSNIIHYTNAMELKQENMVKLPVFLCNFVNVASVIENAISLQNRLEAIAKNENSNLRPIVLFQAQSGANEDAHTFEKLKNKLVNIGIEKEQIAIKTAKINELNGIDLSHKDCKIRYIITINALKEGWDCPYAYILASIANKNSTADVEQLIGRVLRQPNARKYTNQELNVSYVLTCSNDFERTAKSVIAGLNGAGFSKDDYRQKDFRELEEMAEKPQELKDILEYANNENDSDEDKNSEFLSADVNAENIAKNIELGNKTNDILKNAKTQANEYDKEVEKTSSNLDYFGDLEVKASKIKFEVEKIPQFVKLLPSGSILFEELNSKVLEKEDLEKDFKLADKDIQINFDLAEGSIFEVYLSEEDNLPKYKKVTQMQREYFKQYLKTANDETRIRQSINLIFDKLRNDNALNENDLKNYIERIVNNLSDERKAKLLDEIDAYTIKIKNKIKELKSEYKEKVFYDLLNKGNIKIENTFSFEPIIQASKLSSLRDKSLYEEEIDNLNSLENRLLTEIVSLDNIKWWHRNKDMKPGFCINAFINHYPDFIICTENENIIMVEVKGDDRTNDDSKIKLKLGSKWADKAGDKYFYFMVFENSKIEGSLLIDEFIDTMKEL